jgi:hypothetical protein
MEADENILIGIEEPEEPRDMRNFLIIWVGQLISLLGSGLGR